MHDVIAKQVKVKPNLSMDIKITVQDIVELTW